MLIASLPLRMIVPSPVSNISILSETGLPGVIFVLPDSYIDPQNKEYGGKVFVHMNACSL